VANKVTRAIIFVGNKNDLIRIVRHGTLRSTLELTICELRTHALGGCGRIVKGWCTLPQNWTAPEAEIIELAAERMRMPGRKLRIADDLRIHDDDASREEESENFEHFCGNCEQRLNLAAEK
jgi:hypothetical protein